MSLVGIQVGGGIEIGPGINITGAPANLVLSLDAADYTSGPWVDTISDISFTLNGGVTYDSGNGGSLVFNTEYNQCAVSSSSLSNLNTWSVETWHYYDGTNSGGSPCIVTETFTGSGINYALGLIGSGLDAGWYNGGQWIFTNDNYNLIPGNWYQIVGTYDGTYPKLYINNTLIATGNVSGGSAYSSGAGIRLMERWDSADYWGGKLAIVKIYDGDIGASGVANSWNANKNRFGLAPSFTLHSTDFTSANYGNGCEGDLTGFSIGGNHGSTEACFNPNLTSAKITELTNFFNDNGLSISGASYLFDVTWGPGSSTNTTRNVMVIINETSFLVTGTVDTNITGWNTPGQDPLYSSNLRAANGTFLFPATFTLIEPPIADTVNWC